MRKLFPSFGWIEIVLLSFFVTATWIMLLLPMLTVNAYYTWLLFQQPFMLLPIGLTIAASTIIITIYLQNIRASFKRSLNAHGKMLMEASKEAYKAMLINTEEKENKQ